MLFLWALLIVLLLFMWIFFLPIFLVGFFFSIPFFVVSLPISLMIAAGIYLSFGQIKESSLRDIIASCPFEKWFGPIDIPIVQERHLICCHPHGVVCTMALIGIHLRPKSKTLIAVAPIVFAVPVIGWVAKHLGAIPATYNDILTGLKTTSVILLPGGVPEIVAMEKGKQYMKRWGFLRCAKEAKVDILAYIGKEQYYTLLPMPLYDLRMYIACRYNVPIVFPWIFGWYNTWIPKRNRIHTEVRRFHYQYEDTLEQNRLAYYTTIQSAYI